MHLTNDLLAYRDALANAPNLSARNDATQSFMERRGFSSFIYGFVVNPEDPKLAPQSVVFETTLDTGLMDVYWEAGGVSNDPVADRVAQLRAPELFDNEKIVTDPDGLYARHPALCVFLDMKHDFAALTPIRSANGFGSFNAWSGEDTRSHRCKHASALMDLVQTVGGLYHEFLIKNASAAESLSLSSGELDALRYVAHGMTASDVSERLKISERAVEKRLAGARRKLGAVNTTNAVYRGCVLNII